MANKKGNDEFRPTGTMTVLIIFMVTLIVLWVSIYMILLQRGLTS
ncbi:MAG: cytochrome c oxidase subunit 2A [Chloroflexota bacterium]